MTKVLYIDGAQRVGAKPVYALDITGDGLEELYTEDGKLVQSSGSSNTAQSVTFANLSASADLSAGNIVNVSDAVTADVTIGTPINIPIGIFGWSWFQDATGGRTITLPNGTTISGGLPNEIQSAFFVNTGTNQFKLANG